LIDTLTPLELNKIAVGYYTPSNSFLAIALWELIIKYSPSFSEAYISLRTAYAKRGDYKEALIIWNKFIDLFQDHPKVYEVRVWMKDVEGKMRSKGANNTNSK